MQKRRCHSLAVSLASQTDQVVDVPGFACRPSRARHFPETSWFDPFLDLRLEYRAGTPYLSGHASHGVQSNREASQWNEKAFPNPETVLTRVV